MSLIRAVLLDFDGVIVYHRSLFTQFFQQETSDISLGDLRVYDPSIQLFFQHCEEQDIRIMITSLSSGEMIRQTLQSIGVYQWYSQNIPILGYRDIQYDKTDPSFWLSCIERSGDVVDTILVIDDSVDRIMVAKSVHLRTCYYHHFSREKKNWKERADYHAESFLDIIKILSDTPPCNTSLSG